MNGSTCRWTFVGEADEFSLEVREISYLRLRHQTVNGIVELSGDGPGLGAGEYSPDQKRRRDMRHVGAAVVERVEHFVRAAGERHDYVKIQLLAAKETLPFGNGYRQ